MLKTVLLDLDDTLLDFHKSEARAIAKTFVELDIEPKKETIELYSAINDWHWKRFEKGQFTREQVLTGRFEQLFLELGVKRSVQKARDLYEKLLSESCEFVSGAESLLQTLFPIYDLYIVSNGTAWIQDNRIKCAQIARYFKQIFVSQRIGANKPDIAFFNACFQKIPNFSKEQTVIIGDSLSSDIAGGINAGIHTLWFNPHLKSSKEVSPEFEAHSLADIPQILQFI